MMKTPFKKSLETVEAGLNIRHNALKKYNITVNNVRTTVTLEPFIWDILNEVAGRHEVDVHTLCDFINSRRGPDSNLASAIRVFLLSYLYFKGHALV